jgi:aspartate aminotransferase
VVILNGVSKQYAMTGFRIGWSVGPKDLVKAMANIQSHQSGNPCSLSQHAAVAAIHGAQGSVKALRETLQNNRDVLVDLLREVPGLEVEPPEGTFYCFADFRKFDEDSTRLAARFLDRIQVVTVPGIEFGMEGFLRLSYCGSIEDVREGVRRIKWLLDPEGPGTLEARGKVFTR